MSFDVAFDRVIGSEGGLVDNPNDPGGLTKYGISQAAYPDVDIRALTLQGAKALYERDYWAKIHAPDLAPAVAFQLFDFAVNSGIRPAVRALQRAAGVEDDGQFGPATKAACDAMPAHRLVMSLVAERLDFWRSLGTWAHFGNGWTGRGAQNLRYGASDT